MDLLYPLRLVVRAGRRRRQRCAEAKALRAYLSDCDRKTAVIPGTPLHVNLGDSAIFLAQKAFLESCGFAVKEITWEQIHTHRKLLRKIIPKETLIAQLGGGNMGNQWMDEERLHRTLTMDYPHHPTVIFPQTVYFTPDEDGERERAVSASVYGRHHALTLVTREAQSFAVAREMCPDAKILLTPDIVLSATMETFSALPQTRNGILLCMRSDLERSTTDEMQSALERMLANTGETVRKTDMYADVAVTTENRAELVRAKMEEFAAARLVITDRLHGMIFAALTGTPCVVFTNSNYKISGTYRWICHLPYIRFADGVDAAEGLLPELLAMERCVFDGIALRKPFDELKDHLRSTAGR
ncbi:MAG: polysaccharide pyruvyl transferase family protein [Clostridia bacterium]|nr:polysaccharide pyruvyl transferase family protein [Clostridia bacterium]